VAARLPTRRRHWRRVDPRATAKETSKGEDLKWLPPLFTFLAGGDNAVTCKTPKTQQASLF